MICAPSTLPLTLDEARPAPLESKEEQPEMTIFAAWLSQFRQRGTAYGPNSVVKGDQCEWVGLVEAEHPPQDVTEIFYNAT